MGLNQFADMDEDEFLEIYGKGLKEHDENDVKV